MASSSSLEVFEQVDNGDLIGENTIPTWLRRFLEKTFFGSCGAHDDVQKNDLNRYCVTCDSSNCKYCIALGSHDGHKLLTIYRHVYQDVVPLREIETHLDCSKIQPYKCNKKWVISLKPLPHNGSGSHMDDDEACEVCKRKLNDPGRFRFCCLACQVQALMSERDMLPVPEFDETAEERVDEVENPNKRKRTRKAGNPCRAPLS